MTKIVRTSAPASDTAKPAPGRPDPASKARHDRALAGEATPAADNGPAEVTITLSGQEVIELDHARGTNSREDFLALALKHAIADTNRTITD